jgi:SAM-dependent methyltransferase
MSDDLRERRRLSFGSVAEIYDRTRPRYPETLIDDVLGWVSGPPAADPTAAAGTDTPAPATTRSGVGLRVLDVGAGTGIASRQFARRGVTLTSLEPDPEMAAVARRLAEAEGLEIDFREQEFESAELADGAFDLIISATAWHWVDPVRGAEIAASVLRPGGVLAAFWNGPIWDGNPMRPDFDAAYAALGDAFAERGSFFPDGGQAQTVGPGEFKHGQGWAPEEYFSERAQRRYRFSVSYDTETYLQLLSTHSDHNVLAAEPKRRLFDAVGAAIEAHGGRFNLVYETVLLLGRRR